MPTSRELQRQIQTLEDFAARLDDMDESQRIIALHTRDHGMLREIQRTRQQIAAMQREVWAWRDRLHKQAGG